HRNSRSAMARGSVTPALPRPAPDSTLGGLRRASIRCTGTFQQWQLAIAGRMVAFKLLDLVTEIGHVLEAAIDRGEAHIADVVELAQLVHHEAADLDRRHLALATHAQLVHHRTYRGLDAFLGHRPLLQRAVEPRPQLARVKRLAATIALDDDRQLQLDGLQRTEALAACLAATAAADGRAVFGNARVDHAGVGVLAEGAVHWAKTSGWGDGTNESSSRLPAIDPSRPAAAQPRFTRTRQYLRHTPWNRKTAAR